MLCYRILLKLWYTEHKSNEWNVDFGRIVGSEIILYEIRK